MYYSFVTSVAILFSSLHGYFSLTRPSTSMINYPEYPVVALRHMTRSSSSNNSAR